MAKRTHKKVEMTKLDIIVTTGGRFDMLRKCLQALEKQENAPAFNVYLVDNNSDAQDRLRNKDIFEMPIIKDSKRLTSETGFPHFCNLGARMGTAPLIMFLSDDVELNPDVVSKVVETFNDDGIGVVGIKLLFPESSSDPTRPAGKVQHIGLGMNINGAMIHPLMAWSADNPKCCISRNVIAVTGACFSVRRDIFNQAGGFFEGYGLGTFEDMDMCLFAQSLGKKVFINAEAVGYHYVGATAEKKQMPFPIQQNSMIFAARWGQSGLMQWSDWTMY